MPAYTFDINDVTFTDEKDAGYDFDATPEQLREKYIENLSVWQNSTCKERFLGIIDRNRPTNGWRFDKIVYIAGGTFLDVAAAGRRLYQFACVQDTADELVKRGHAGVPTVQIFAQETLYFQQDRELFSQLRVTVLKPALVFEGLQEANAHMGPNLTPSASLVWDMDKAKDHMGPNTVLFEFGCEIGEAMCKDLCEVETGIYVDTGTT